MPLFLNRFRLMILFIVLIAAFGLFSAQSVSAADTITTNTYLDSDGDGTVDRIRWVMDENVTACVYEAGDWTLDTASEMNISITGLACTGSNTILDILVSADANETGAATNPGITYDDNPTNGSVTLTSGDMGNHIGTTATDAATPVFLSTSPADSATDVSKTTDVVFTFSEAMVTDFAEGTEFTISPDPGGFSAVFSGGNTIVTLSAPTLSCGVTYTITTTEAEIAASSGSPTIVSTGGPVDGDFSFTTIATGCSSGTSAVVAEEEEEEQSYEIVLDDISDASAGDFYTLNWTSSENFDFVNIYYTDDDGAIYTDLAENVANDGSYKWSIPLDIDDDFTVTIEATDLASVLASDTASVGEDTSATEEDETSEEETVDEEEVADEEDSSDDAAAPAWEVEGVEPGDIIRGETFSTLYYITEDYERRVFVNEAVYFTWYDDFDDIEIISDDDLAAYSIGGLMLPKSGVVLVTIQSDPTVYALGEGSDSFTPLLQEIENEEMAEDLWGEDWTDYIIDVESTLIAQFEVGHDVDDAYGVDIDKMKKREDLHG
jgi:hypothetical protein